MKKKSAIIISLLFLWTASYLNAQRSETRDLPGFSSISVGEAIDLYLIPGSVESAKIQVDGIDLDQVLTEVKGETLKLRLEKNNYRNIDVEIWVTYRSLERLELSSASSVLTEGVIKSESLDIEASSAADGRLEVDVNELVVEVSSSADLEISGKATRQEVSVSSAGQYDSYDLECEEAEVSASSAGSARVNVKSRIDANASSAGSIRYRGSPEKIYEEENSGGSIKSAN